MSTAFKIVAVVYLIGVIANCVLKVHGIYLTGGFQREHTAAEFLLVMALYGMAAAIWPAFVALVIMGHLGALPRGWELSFVKLGLLVLLFAAMVVGTWAITHVHSPTKYVLHAKLRSRLTPIVGSQLVELKTLMLALLVGLGSMLSLVLL
ncbi:hypothetical protein [Bradyrhizobium sp. HKCCYLR20261]|uniref:hypothetical protein n=1 Tax=unclassified Bradyrhizobium TaxID=2631580 RepID=UPI003EBB5316